MPDPIEPTPDQVRAVLLQAAAIVRGWAATNAEEAVGAFHDSQRRLAAQREAAQVQAARAIENIAVRSPRQRPVSQSAADAVTGPTQSAQDGDGTAATEATRSAGPGSREATSDA